MNGNVIMGIICAILTGCFINLECGIAALAFGILAFGHMWCGLKELGEDD